MNKTKYQGYTLIEMMIVSAILMLVFVLIFIFWRLVSDNFSISFNESRSIDEAHALVALLASELREAQTADNGNYALELVDDQTLIFYADTDEDGQTERVKYWLENTDIKRGVTEPVGDPAVYDPATESVRVVASQVINGGLPLFTYYNRDWPKDMTNNPLMPSLRQLDTRTIGITAAVDADNYPGGIATASGSVQLRNLKDNY